MASSIEMSFSASRLRSAPRSMSIGLSPVRVGRDVAELQEYLSRAKLAVAKLTLPAGQVKQHAAVTGAQYPALHGGRVAGLARRPGPAGQRDPDQAAGGAAPVPGLGQRPVRTGRGDLQGVRGLAHRAVLVEL